MVDKKLKMINKKYLLDKQFITSFTIFLLFIFSVFTISAIGGDKDKIQMIFQEIEVELDKIDIPKEHESDRIQVIITKVLLTYGYDETNSGILIRGRLNGSYQLIDEIIVQIHDHETYEFIYYVNRNESERKTYERKRSMENI